jgi:hypothetical protein
LRIRITTSGKHGRLTVPFDISVANSLRNASAEPRLSVLVATGVDSIGFVGAAGLGVASGGLLETAGLAGGGLVETAGLPGAGGGLGETVDLAGASG